MPKYFAKLNKDNVVEQVIVADSLEWVLSTFGGEWEETFLDKKNKNFASVGNTFVKAKKNFHGKQLFKSWRLDKDLKWQPPIPKPPLTEETKKHLRLWNEERGDWDTTIIEEDIKTIKK